MKVGGQQKQNVAQKIEKEPRYHRTRKDLQDSDDAGKAAGSQPRSIDYLFQAGGAEDPIIVFSDALAAEIAAAFRTAGYGFTEFMVAAAPMNDIIHQQLPRRRFLVLPVKWVPERFLSGA